MQVKLKCMISVCTIWEKIKYFVFFKYVESWQLFQMRSGKLKHVFPYFCVERNLWFDFKIVQYKALLKQPLCNANFRPIGWVYPFTLPTCNQSIFNNWIPFIQIHFVLDLFSSGGWNSFLVNCQQPMLSIMVIKG